MILSSRASGVLLHISSLPSEFGIGDFGSAAYHFADRLSEAGQKIWQILPLTPTDLSSGNSPYSSSSAFAGNTLFISPELMMKDNLLSAKIIKNRPNFPVEHVDYKAVHEFKQHLFTIAFQNFQKQNKHKEYEQFCSLNSYWLDDYSLFTALKTHFAGKPWFEWSDALRLRNPDVLGIAAANHIEAIEREKFLQFQFHKQWTSLKKYCHAKHIHLLGDIPIYSSHDSADVWSNPHIFQLNSRSLPTSVAGVPPDYFSPKGQRWGNPLYNWTALQKTEFIWWKHRLKRNFELYDAVRIDHFRGLVAYWDIPAHEKTAVNGTWQSVPTLEFLQSLTATFDHFPVIAEDLGTITDDVKEVMEKFTLPGMKVLQFAFDDTPNNPYLPHNYTKNCLVYTGTHDNNTTRGWYKSDASAKSKHYIKKYLSATPKEVTIHEDFMKLALSSVAMISIIPLQDVLGLGPEARMNQPSTSKGNWSWRATKAMMKEKNFRVLRSFTSIYGRL
ncbi:MAG: 4-alpha-glucanotransferase [Ignavibacteria bacterium]|nr:4-alpha-glucanotransferase [Ignavibacteria bacterium]